MYPMQSHSLVVFRKVSSIVCLGVVHKDFRINKTKPSDSDVVCRYKGFLDVGCNQVT